MPPKYLRRLISIPLVAVLFVAVVVLIPIWLPLTALADVIVDVRRMRFTRLGFVVVLLLFNEVRTLLLVLVLWLRCGLGFRIWTPRSQARLQRILHVYGGGLVRCTQRALGVRIEIDGLDEALTGSEPFLVLGHHTSLIDSALPVTLLAPHGFALSYVIKKSLAYAPAFDCGGHLLPVHFVDRTRSKTSDELDAIKRLAGQLQGHSCFVLFPEGSFFSPRQRERAIERIQRDAPHLVDRAAALRHTLAPRPGGALAMLDGAPDLDVIFLAHSGLEQFNSLANIVRNVPVRQPVRVHVWRVPRADVPNEAGARYDWLFEQFERVDAFVTADLDSPR